MMRRSLLLASGGMLAAPALLRARPLRFSGGGTPATIEINAPNGSLTNGYGTWSWGRQWSPPAQDGIPLYTVLLNGRQCWGWGDTFFGMQKLLLANGNNIYARWRDSQWYNWTNYFWFFNGSPDPDLVTPLAPPPSTYSPPYTPSADGTSISGGTGTVTTVDGIWTFGAAVGDGSYRPMLNGIPVLGGGWGAFELVVNSHGQLFMHLNSMSVGNWYAWQNFGLSAPPASGPTSGPIPIDIVLTPPLGQPPTASPVNTVLTSIAIVMSDGSAYSGSIGLSGSSNAVLSGTNLVTNVTPYPYGGEGFDISATQNGYGYTVTFTVNAV